MADHIPDAALSDMGSCQSSLGALVHQGPEDAWSFMGGCARLKEDAWAVPLMLLSLKDIF